jgi:hypothetical protein
MKIINVIKKGFVGCSKNIEENTVRYRVGAHDWLGEQHIIAYIIISFMLQRYGTAAMHCT